MPPWAGTVTVSVSRGPHAEPSGWTASVHTSTVAASAPGFTRETVNANAPPPAGTVTGARSRRTCSATGAAAASARTV